jgi:hypothetical protein
VRDLLYHERYCKEGSDRNLALYFLVIGDSVYVPKCDLPPAGQKLDPRRTCLKSPNP